MLHSLLFAKHTTITKSITSLSSLLKYHNSAFEKYNCHKLYIITFITIPVEPLCVQIWSECGRDLSHSS